MVKAMNRKGGVHIMNFVPGAANILYRGKQYCFIIETTNYKFFNSSSHKIYLLPQIHRGGLIGVLKIKPLQTILTPIFIPL